MYQTPPPPVLFVVALSLSLSMSGRLAVAQSDVDFVNPTDGGGSWLTKWNNWWAGGEPLNVVISARSDPRIISDLDTFLDYCSSLKFSRQCFQWEDGESLQAANLGDGNDLVNQTTILRYDYDDPIFGTCTESMQGGNHFRIFRQNGTRVASSGGGAWFLAVSKEHNLAKNHMIVPNGYDLGRDELVEIAVNPNGTRSPVSQTLYRATVRAVGGREYFGAVGPNEINHGVGIDGRIAVLTVTVAEEGNGKTANSSWFTSITLTNFAVVVGIIVLTVLSLGLFLWIHHDHHHDPDGRRGVVVAPWQVGKGRDAFPLLDGSRV